MTGIQQPTTPWPLFALLLAAHLLGGCGGPEGEGGAAGGPPPYPSSLSASSTPRQVAQVLIQALDQGDDQALQGLVAAKHEADAVDAIYRKHGREHHTDPADAARVAASGWKTTYAWFQPGATQVADERIRGDTAVVTARGLNPTTNRPRDLTIEMVTEDGVWKVRAGLESREL